MAKKQRKKNSKCPEPFNFLTDIAAGIAMNAIASKMEDKYQYQKRSVPNPYRASALGFTAGKLNKTDDIIKLGGLMGSMGAFDPVQSDKDRNITPSKMQTFHNENWTYDNINFFTSAKKHNRYTWRMNCEDGSSYGITPFDYETRESYNEALQKRKEWSANNKREESPNNNKQCEVARTETRSAESTAYVFYRVSRLDNGLNDYYRSVDKAYSVGETVSVTTSDGKIVKAVIISVNEYDSSSLPKPLEITGFIIDKYIT